MSRLPYLGPDDLAPEQRDLLARDINLARILAHSPEAARAFTRLGGFIRSKSTLDPRLRELAILQVGWMARSPYEWSHHVELGYRFGVSDADIEALIADTAGRPTALAPLDRAVLRAARELGAGPAGGTAEWITDATWAELDAALSPEHLVDLIVTIAFYAAVVRFLGATQMDVEESYQRHLHRHPLPAGATSPFERSHHIDIEAPAQIVLDYVSNPQSWQEWMPATHQIDSPDRPMRAGETFVEQWGTRQGAVTLDWLVAAREDPTLWVAETRTDFTGPIVARYELAETATGCRYARRILNPERPKPPTPQMVHRMDTEAAICLANIKRNVEEAA
jgi:alkylhydroperoxidase family enzyme